MTEILKALDAITSRVLAYRPKDKGVAATKMRDQIKRGAGADRRAENGYISMQDLADGGRTRPETTSGNVGVLAKVRAKNAG